MREKELRDELANWKEKYNEINQKYEEVSTKVKEYQEKKQSYGETSKLLQEELDQLNKALGKTEVQGEGIEITLTDTEENKLSADNLLTIVNDLKLAGAEAISINNERVVNMTDIVDIGNTFIKVNGQRISSPYVIKAIGNQTYLESGVSGNGGSVDKLQKDGYDAKIEKNKKIKILKYNDEINTKYIN